MKDNVLRKNQAFKKNIRSIRVVNECRTQNLN